MVAVQVAVIAILVDEAAEKPLCSPYDLTADVLISQRLTNHSRASLRFQPPLLDTAIRITAQNLSVY